LHGLTPIRIELNFNKLLKLFNMLRMGLQELFFYVLSKRQVNCQLPFFFSIRIKQDFGMTIIAMHCMGDVRKLGV